VKFLRDDPHALTGAYVLDALEDGERDRFERHLRRCQSCVAEVRGLRETATRLAMAETLQPPAAMRQQVLASAARTRQLPPLTDQQPERAPRTIWLPRLAVAVAAVSLIGVVLLGIAQFTTQHRLDSAQARNQAIAAVLAAPGVRIMSGTTSASGTVTVVVSRQQGKMIVTSAGLPALPASKVYELWLMGPSRTRPAGLLPAAKAGRTEPLLASAPLTSDRIGVTVEPAGGTARPTTTPILIMTVPA
jgi:anti-sigma-K factor RskA